MSESKDSPTPAKVARLSSSITEISSDPEPSLVDAETQKALEDIDSCQNDIDFLNEKASEEILQVEMKYNRLRRPHFEKRNTLINHIPNFWVTSFLNHPRMANIVEEEEEECLHYLKQVDVEEFEDIKSGYTIKFLFAPNPYFADDAITKELRLVTIDDKPTCTSTKIHWKPNMDLTKNAHGKHTKRRGDGRSFFSWLTEDIDPLKDKIAEMIRDDLWPNPLQYYLASDIEVEENGIDSEDDRHIIEDDSVVIVGDDDDSDEMDDDDDDVYEVKDDDDEDDELSGEELEETVESIEVEDDDDDAADDDEDAIEVLGSDSEAELLQETSELSHDPETSELSHDPETSEISHDPETSEISHEPETSEISRGPDTSQMTDEIETTQDDSVVDVPDTTENSGLEKTDMLQAKESDSGKDVLENDKAVSDNDDTVLRVSQSEDAVVEDGNESDLLKEDDDDETGLAENDLSKQKSSTEGTLYGDEKTKEGVD